MKMRKYSLTQSLLTLALVASTAAVSAQDDSIISELKLGTIEGVGNYKLRIDQYGEPAPMPLRISLEVDCGTSRAVMIIAACGGGEVSSDKKNLVLSFLKPDKKEKCARTVRETLELAEVCK